MKLGISSQDLQDFITPRHDLKQKIISSKQSKANPKLGMKFL
jgi:hypothetical protein